MGQIHFLGPCTESLRAQSCLPRNRGVKTGTERWTMDLLGIMQLTENHPIRAHVKTHSRIRQRETRPAWPVKEASSEGVLSWLSARPRMRGLERLHPQPTAATLPSQQASAYFYMNQTTRERGRKASLYMQITTVFHLYKIT